MQSSRPSCCRVDVDGVGDGADGDDGGGVGGVCVVLLEGNRSAADARPITSRGLLNG